MKLTVLTLFSLVLLAASDPVPDAKTAKEVTAVAKNEEVTPDVSAEQTYGYNVYDKKDYYREPYGYRNYDNKEYGRYYDYGYLGYGDYEKKDDKKEYDDYNRGREYNKKVSEKYSKEEPDLKKVVEYKDYEKKYDEYEKKYDEYEKKYDDKYYDEYRKRYPYDKYYEDKKYPNDKYEEYDKKYENDKYYDNYGKNEKNYYDNYGKNYPYEKSYYENYGKNYPYEKYYEGYGKGYPYNYEIYGKNYPYQKQIYDEYGKIKEGYGKSIIDDYYYDYGIKVPVYDDKVYYRNKLFGRQGLGFDKRTAYALGLRYPLTPKLLEVVKRPKYEKDKDDYYYN